MDEDLTFLVLKAQLGDRKALNALLSEIEVPLYSVINRIVKDHASSKDLLQEVLLIIYAKLRWLHEPKVFKTWAYRIAVREVFRFLKKKRVEFSYNGNDVPSGADTVNETAYADEAVSEKMSQFIGGLSPASKLIIELHYYEKLTLQQISEVLEISVGTVKSRLHYGLATLRKLIETDKLYEDK